MAVTLRTNYHVRRTAEPEPPGLPVDLTGYPSPSNTGPRFAPTDTTSGTLISSAPSQVIERLDITGRIIVRHSNVTVRDVTVHSTNLYAILVEAPSGGSCPTGVTIEYTEVEGLDPGTATHTTGIYANCGTTIDHVYIHGTSLGVRLLNDSTLTNSYLHASRNFAGAHREGVICNGGARNTLQHNSIFCTGGGCTAALSPLGDFAAIEDWLIQDNLFATDGGYCAYGGSEASESFPDASNVQFINNHFSTAINPLCGSFGYLTAFEAARGNVFTGNVWHETGVLIPDQ